MIALSETECRLINTEVFLRLQRIKQLSHTYLVYPSAAHTRFEHSLGAMHMAGLICEKLGLDHDMTRLVRIAALLHDVGHGPFSHLFESVLEPINPKNGAIHELITRKMILNDPEIKSILGKDRHAIAELLNDDTSKVQKKWRFMSDIVSGSLDADKLDYLARDSFYLGVNYGKFDLVRILHTICPTPDNERLGILRKGMNALENYRLARHLMTAQGYKHHTGIVADRMFLNSMDLAINTEKVIPVDVLKVNHKSFLPFYKTLDDCSIVNLVMSSKKSKISREILEDLYRHRLLKRVYEAKFVRIRDYATKQALLYKKDKLSNIARDIRKQLKLPAHMLFVHESNIPIKLYGETDIPCVEENGMVNYMNTLSSFQADSEITAYYVFGPESKREIIHQKFASADIDP